MTGIILTTIILLIGLAGAMVAVGKAGDHMWDWRY